MTICLLRLLLFSILAYLFVETSARPGKTVKKRDGIDDSPPLVMDPVRIEQMKKYKLEVLKAKILNAIHVFEPTVIQSPAQVPINIAKILTNDLEDGEEFIRKPLNDDFRCLLYEDEACSRFEFEISLENKSISSVHVWFQKKVPEELLFISFRYCSSVVDDERICDSSEILKETKTDHGWTMFEAPLKLASMSPMENRFCSVEAFGSNFESEGERQPLLIANFSGKRKRRSLRTNLNKVCTKECCKIDFNISFKEIGWNFVVTPTEFNAYMCYGKCTNNHLNAFSNHYLNLMQLALTNKTSVEKVEQPWTPCCSPSELLPLDMIYEVANDTNINNTHTVIRQRVPDMIVKECRCW